VRNFGLGLAGSADIGAMQLAKDFEVLTGTTENWMRIAMIKLTLAKCL